MDVGLVDGRQTGPALDLGVDEHDRRQNVSPHLTQGDQTAEDAVEASQRRVRVEAGGVGVIDGESTEVHRLGAPHRPREQTEEQRRRHESEVPRVHVGDDGVHETDAGRRDDGPLGGEAGDDDGREKARDDSGAVHAAQRQHPDCTVRVERTLHAVERHERAEEEHEGDAEHDEVLPRASSSQLGPGQLVTGAAVRLALVVDELVGGRCEDVATTTEGRDTRQ